MARSYVRDAVCVKCGGRAREACKRTFLGFFRFTCSACGHEGQLPLSSGYRATYWVVLVLMVLVFIGSLAEGQITFPGLMGAGVLVAIIKDLSLQHEQRTAPPSAATPPGPGAST